MDIKKDREWEEDQITKVISVKDGWEITKEDGLCFFVDKKHGIEPVIGGTVRFYGKGVGYPVRGLMLDGKVVFYKTPAKQKKEHKRWVKDTRKKYQNEYKELMEEIKDEESFETADISGMGGGYERACQLVLQEGREYLSDKPDFVWDYKEYKNVCGICWSDSKQAKELDAAMMKPVNNDCSGAMHQVVISHLSWIHKNGHDKWLKELADRKYIYPQGLPKPTF